VGLGYIYYIKSTSQLNILPLLIETRLHPKPKRNPGTFVEDFGKDASSAKITYLGESKFSFIYKKSEVKENPFAGVWFPMENLDVNFSKYDFIEIGLITPKASVIPINLSVQTKKKTHQYVRNFINIDQQKTTYILALKDFITPASWYKSNRISQAQIAKPDLSRIEAISFESCQVLGKGIEDKLLISKITLKKDLFYSYLLTVGLIIFIISLLAFLFFVNIDDVRKQKSMNRYTENGESEEARD